MYTAPAYFMTMMISITICLLLKFFQDRQRIVRPKAKDRKSKRRTAIDEMANTTTVIGLTTYDACIVGCMLLNIASKGSIASFETLGISYAETYFDMYSARAGTIVASCGTLGVVALLCMGRLEKLFSDVQLIAGGLVVMAAGIFSLSSVQEDSAGDWRYVLAIFMIYSVGYPIGHTAVIGLFSKSKYKEQILLRKCPLSPSERVLKKTFFSVLSSCGSKATGNINGLVCIRWVLGSYLISHHGWIRFQLCKHYYTLLYPHWRTGNGHYLCSNESSHPRHVGYMKIGFVLLLDMMCGN